MFDNLGPIGPKASRAIRLFANREIGRDESRSHRNSDKRELRFRRAAQRLHVSHPALSQQIQDLEDKRGQAKHLRRSNNVGRLCRLVHALDELVDCLSACGAHLSRKHYPLMPATLEGACLQLPGSGALQATLQVSEHGSANVLQKSVIAAAEQAEANPVESPEWS